MLSTLRRACWLLVGRTPTQGILLGADGILAEANHVVHENKLVKGCFVRLKHFQANSVKGKQFVLHSQSAGCVANVGQ